MEVSASSDWTLSQVFAKVAPLLAFNKGHREEGEYCFFMWERGREGPQYVSHSPTVEASMFGSKQSSGEVSITTLLLFAKQSALLIFVLNDPSFKIFSVPSSRLLLAAETAVVVWVAWQAVLQLGLGLG